MPAPALHSRAEVLEWLKGVSDEALAGGLVPLFPKIENRLKRHNPQKRFVIQCDDDVAARFYEQKGRFLENIGQKGIALDLMAKLWEAMSDDALRAWVSDDPNEIARLTKKHQAQQEFLAQTEE